MSKTIDFYFDFASPASFLGYTQIEGIAERTGAALVWKPMLLDIQYPWSSNSRWAAEKHVVGSGCWCGSQCYWTHTQACGWM